MSMVLFKKIFVALLFFGWSSLIFAQQKTILKILNLELQKEVKNQLQSPNFEGDTVRIVKPFTINEKQILSYEIKKTSPYFQGYKIIKQEVPLKSLIIIIKDIHVILLTEEEAVTTTTFNSLKGASKKEISYGNLFFLGLSSQKQNEYLGVEIQKAFKNAGIPIQKTHWYD